MSALEVTRELVLGLDLFDMIVMTGAAVAVVAGGLLMVCMVYISRRELLVGRRHGEEEMGGKRSGRCCKQGRGRGRG